MEKENVVSWSWGPGWRQKDSCKIEYKSRWVKQTLRRKGLGEEERPNAAQW